MKLDGTKANATHSVRRLWESGFAGVGRSTSDAVDVFTLHETKEQTVIIIAMIP
jgi:hypothetical protein